MPRRHAIPLFVLVALAGCGEAPTGSARSGTGAPGVQPLPSTPQPLGLAAPPGDPGCASASLHLYSRDHFGGDELCFYGAGDVALANYTLASNSAQSWLNNLHGVEVGLQPIFLNGTFKVGESFSWFYPTGFRDDLGRDLPFNVTDIIIASGYDTPGGACGSGTCGFATTAGGGVVVCGNGSCPNGQPCNNNSCCVPDNASACAGRECGTSINNCGQSIDCGAFAGACVDPQRSCTGAGRCCYAPAAVCGAQQCGTAGDGCGGIVSCGTCGGGAQCISNQCVGGTCKGHKCPFGTYWNGDDCLCERPCKGTDCQ